MLIIVTFLITMVRIDFFLIVTDIIFIIIVSSLWNQDCYCYYNYYMVIIINIPISLAIHVIIVNHLSTTLLLVPNPLSTAVINFHHANFPRPINHYNGHSIQRPSQLHHKAQQKELPTERTCLTDHSNKFLGSGFSPFRVYNRYNLGLGVVCLLHALRAKLESEIGLLKHL